MAVIALQQNLCIYQKDIFHFVVCVDSSVLALRWLDTVLMTDRLNDIGQMTNGGVCSNVCGNGETRMEHAIRHFHYETPF